MGHQSVLRLLLALLRQVQKYLKTRKIGVAVYHRLGLLPLHLHQVMNGVQELLKKAVLFFRNTRSSKRPQDRSVCRPPSLDFGISDAVPSIAIGTADAVPL